MCTSLRTIVCYAAYFWIKDPEPLPLYLSFSVLLQNTELDSLLSSRASIRNRPYNLYPTKVDDTSPYILPSPDPARGTTLLGILLLLLNYTVSRADSTHPPPNHPPKHYKKEQKPFTI